MRWSNLIVVLIVCLVTWSLTRLALTPPKYPVYEYRDVEVQSRVAPNAWWMKKDDGRFLYQGCPDFPNERVIWTGYVASKVRWEEQGNCKSILRSDLGFWWKRQENGDVDRIKLNQDAKEIR